MSQGVIPKSDMESLSLSLFDVPHEKSSDNSCMILIKKACAEKKFDIVKFMVDGLPRIPSEQVDEFGNNILRFVITHFDEMGGSPYLATLLKKQGIKDIINEISQVDGFTPAFLACYLGHHEVVDMLRDAGADLKIKSRSGAQIAIATPTVTEMAKSDVAKEKSTIMSAIPKYIESFFGMMKQSDDIPVSTIGLSATEKPSDKPARVPSEAAVKSMRSIPPVASELSTEAFINGVISGSLSAPQQKPATPIAPVAPVAGGSRAVAVGQRLLNNAPDYHHGGSSESAKSHKSSKSSRKPVELSRETNKIHEEAVEEIKRILKLGDSEDDDRTAKIYKSVLYYKVKELHPDLSGYDRAVEMKKLVTKEELENIDFEKEKKKRDDIRASSDMSETSAPKKPRSKKVSETSSDSASESSEKKPRKKKSKKSESESDSVSSASSSAMTSSPDLNTDIPMYA